VDPATRDRVLAAMSTLGYHPNHAARSLATGRFGSIGIITSTLSSYGTSRTLDGVADAARKAGYTLTLLPLSLPSSGEVSGATARMAGQNVDGIIVMVESDALERAIIDLPHGTPVVVSDGDASHRFRSVDSDPVPGIKGAIEHLVSLGHTHIWHVAGPANSYDAQIRRDVWESTLQSHRLPVSNVYYGDWSSRSGFRIGEHLATLDGPTAIFSANDQMALGLVRAYTDAGIDVPRDISIVGFDDMTESEQFVPRLTTIRQDFAEMGRRAVAALLEAMDSSDTREIEQVPTELVIRESTAPPRS
jgi:DNA-binding LacI/PurR family transcriptional regulator